MVTSNSDWEENPNLKLTCKAKMFTYIFYVVNHLIIIKNIKFFLMKLESLASQRVKPESFVTTQAKLGVQRLKAILMLLGLIYILIGQYYKIGEIEIRQIIERSNKTYTFEAADSVQLVATAYVPAKQIMDRMLEI